MGYFYFHHEPQHDPNHKIERANKNRKRKITRSLHRLQRLTDQQFKHKNSNNNNLYEHSKQPSLIKKRESARKALNAIRKRTPRKQPKKYPWKVSSNNSYQEKRYIYW